MREINTREMMLVVSPDEPPVIRPISEVELEQHSDDTTPSEEEEAEEEQEAEATEGGAEEETEASEQAEGDDEETTSEVTTEEEEPTQSSSSEEPDVVQTAAVSEEAPPEPSGGESIVEEEPAGYTPLGEDLGLGLGGGSEDEPIGLFGADTGIDPTTDLYIPPEIPQEESPANQCREFVLQPARISPPELEPTWIRQRRGAQIIGNDPKRSERDTELLSFQV